MLTLLPHRDFEMTAKTLLNHDLEIQVAQTVILLDTLHEVDAEAVQAWGMHPAVAMWKGYELHLARYGLTMAEEYEARELNKDTKAPPIDYLKRIKWHFDTASEHEEYMMELPGWMTNSISITMVEQSHRGVLASRARYYRELWPEATFGTPIYWPRADGLE